MMKSLFTRFTTLFLTANVKIGASGVRLYRRTALNELELMHLAIEAGDYKKASQHQKAADSAVDKMIAARKMTNTRKSFAKG